MKPIHIALLTIPALAGVALLNITLSMQLRELRDKRPTVSPLIEDTTPAHILNIREKREPLTPAEQEILNH